jgi:uncharacterized membrane protein YccC
MPTGPQNAKSRQVAIRLPHDLDARIEQFANTELLTQSQALIALLERGLAGVHDSGIHRDAPEWDAPRDTPWGTPTDLVARLAALEAAVAELQRGTAAQPVAERQAPAKSKVGELHPAHHYLGPLCQRGHEWQGTGQSRYSKRNQGCLECEAERARERRAAKKATG